MINIALNLDEIKEFPRVLGISCHSKPVKFAWKISQNRDFQIERSENLVYDFINSEFICFKITHIENKEELLLIGNRGSNNWFYKKQQELDFFIIDFNKNSTAWNKFLNLINDLESVIFATELDINGNSKDHLNFLDIELCFQKSNITKQK